MRTAIVVLALVVAGCRTGGGRPATLLVRAQDGATGAAVASPEVTVAPAAPSRAAESSGGGVRLAGLRPGRAYAVTVRAAGYGRTSRAVRLCAGRMDTLVVPLAPLARCDLDCDRLLEPEYARPCGSE